MELVQWQSPPSSLSLGRDVHIWRASLDVDLELLEAQRSVLSEREIGKIDRLRLPVVYRRSLAAQVTLRQLLSRYLDCPPREVTYQYGSHGKPCLDAAVHPSPIYFNMTHSNDMALYAISDFAEVGVDVELVKPGRQMLEIAERYFAPSEYQQMLSLPEVEQLSAFYKCWTAKEAFVKATGEGLSFGLDRFEVDLSIGAGDARSSLIKIDNSIDAARPWYLTSFSPEENYLGAIATEGQPNELCFIQYEF